MIALIIGGLNMGKTVLRKEELIAMLQSISSQLDQLEKSIETIIPKKQIEWQKEQSMLIESCEKRLAGLEGEIIVVEEMEAGPEKETLSARRNLKPQSFSF
jgi:hypothetical protein